MIGRLQGIIIEKQPPTLILDVNGVGYEVFSPMSTFYQLPAMNERAHLFIHMVVREDAQLLYGFFSERERTLFRSLIKVNGVGPKLALTILSGVEPDVFVRCVQDNNATSLTGIPGIGKKTAERLIIETRDVLANWQLDNDIVAQDSFTHITTEPNAIQDAISALTALGYKNHEAKRAILQIEKPDASSEELIRLALQNMLAK